MQLSTASASIPALLLIAAPLTAQPPTARDAAERTARAERSLDVAAVLRKLSAAHRGAGSPDVDRFRAQIMVEQKGKSADSKVQVHLDVKFRAKRKLRYRIDEGDRKIERGWGKWPWQRLGEDEQVVKLGDVETQDDMRKLLRELQLANQLLRFLDPAAIGEKLEAPTLTRARLRVPSEGMVDCHVISGITERFPLYSAAGERRRVQLRLWIDAETFRLRSLRAEPLDERGKPGGKGELIMLTTLRERKRLLLPSKLTITEYDLAKKTQGTVEVTVTAIALNPEVEDADFDPDTPFK